MQGKRAGAKRRSQNTAARWINGDAYLAHYSQLLDQQTMNQPSLIGHLFAGAIAALFGFAVYKGLVCGYESIPSRFQGKKGAEQE